MLALVKGIREPHESSFAAVRRRLHIYHIGSKLIESCIAAGQRDRVILKIVLKWTELNNVCACAKLVARSWTFVLIFCSTCSVPFDVFVCLVCAKKWTLELSGFILIVRFTYRNNKRSIAHGILT